MPARNRPASPAQTLMETSLMARLYESFLWRRNPLLFLLLGINSTKEYQIISGALALTGSERILDLACGPGIYTRRFAREGSRGNVIGLDLSWPMLTYGARLVKRDQIRNVNLLQGDALTLPIADAYFDVVNCSAALHLFGDLPETLSEVSRVLKKGGQFTFSTFRYPKDPLIQTILWLRRNIAGIRSFRQEELESGLHKAGFGDIRILHSKGIWVVMRATKMI